MKKLLFVVAGAVIAGVVFADDAHSALFHMLFLWWVPFLLIFVTILVWLRLGRDKTLHPSELTEAERKRAKQIETSVSERKD